MYARGLHNMYFSVSISFPVVRQLPLVNRHTCRLVPSSDVKFVFFITLSTSFSLFTFDRPRCLRHGDEVIIRISHLLSSMPTTCPYLICIFTRNIKYAYRK